MDAETRYYITTAIDYPNSRPHIGTAFEKIGADVQARFRRMEGASVHFLMGNDENTIKVPAARPRAGPSSPRPMSTTWPGSSRRSGRRSTSPTTTSSRPARSAITSAAGSSSRRSTTPATSTKGVYAGHYCTGCEAFKTEKEVAEGGGKCPNHPSTPLTWLEEEIYFFRLSAYRDRLLAHYEAHPEFIQPESRRNEILSLVEAELQDVAITRKGFTWGIKVPFDPEQTIYVWFDALLNYITAIGYGTDEERFRRLWPADVHVIGKDITRFHCALWPAMLMSAGLPLPRKVFGHGFVYRKNEETGEVQKLSKSLGNVVEPMDLIEKFSSEAFRYYFMSQCPFGGDGEFSFERFAEVYNSGLANNLGNLYSRTLTMCVKYFDGRLDGGEPVDATAMAARARLRGPRRRRARARRLVRVQRGACSGSGCEVVDAGEPLHPGDRALQAGQDRPGGLPCGPRQPGRLAEDRRDPDQAVPAADRGDVLSRLQLRGDEAVGPRLLRRRPGSRSSSPGLHVTAPLTGGKPAPLFPKIEVRPTG